MYYVSVHWKPTLSLMLSTKIAEWMTRCVKAKLTITRWSRSIDSAPWCAEFIVSLSQLIIERLLLYQQPLRISLCKPIVIRLRVTCNESVKNLWYNTSVSKDNCNWVLHNWNYYYGNLGSSVHFNWTNDDRQRSNQASDIVLYFWWGCRAKCILNIELIECIFRKFINSSAWLD